MKAIDSLQEIEAKTYPPLYRPVPPAAPATSELDSSVMMMESLHLPSFAQQIMDNEERIKTRIQEMKRDEQHASSSLLSPFVSSVNIVIKHGRVDLNEDCDKNLQQAPSLAAQTFRLDFKALQVTHIVKREEDDRVAYVVLRTNDLCLLEFDEVLQPFSDEVSTHYLALRQSAQSQSHPHVNGKAQAVLFRTLEAQTFGHSALTTTTTAREDESDVLHLFLSLRVKHVESHQQQQPSVTDDTFMQTFMLVNLRALTHELRLESEWHTKLAEFFSVERKHKHHPQQQEPQQQEPQHSNVVQNVTNVYVNAYDCCVSYNPIPVAQRLVVACEKIRISTNVVALSPMVSVGIECRDGAVYLHPQSAKAFSQDWLQLFVTRSHQLKQPYLHRLPGNLLADHLDSIGFVRIVDFDWIEAFISSNKQIKKDEIHVSGGTIKIGTCQDSTQSLLSILRYFIEQIIEQPTIEDVEILLPDHNDNDNANDNYNDNDNDDDGATTMATTMTKIPVVQKSVPFRHDDVRDKIQSHNHAFNILGNIDDHMFSANADADADADANLGSESVDDDDDDDEQIGIDSSGADDTAAADGIQFIADYARQSSEAQSAGSPYHEYVDLENMREFTTPFHATSLKSMIEKPPPQTTQHTEQSSGWYHHSVPHMASASASASSARHHVDVHYFDRKLHALSDPNLPQEFPRPQTLIKIKDLSVHWKVFGGLDFHQSQAPQWHSDGGSDEASHEYLQHEYDALEQSIQREQEHKHMHDASLLDLKRYSSNRKVDQVMQVCLDHAQLSFYQFGAHERIANRLVLTIESVEILDLIQASNFHRLLCLYNKHVHRHDHADDDESMFKLQMNCMRPEPVKDPERLESDISFDVAPLRLNVDQLAIDFLIAFFSSFQQPESHDDDDDDDDDDVEIDILDCEPENDDDDDDAVDEGGVEEKLDQQAEEAQAQEEEKRVDDHDAAAEMYFQKFTFSDVVVCVDYNPRRVDFDRLRNGDYSQFVHLFPLCLVEIQLQSFEICGCNGWDACFVELAKFWALDFAKHQTHKYVAGIQPVRSLVNMGSGIADLVIIPVKQYKRDGRLTKGLHLGAKSAVQKITLETLDLSDGVFTTVHSFLSSVEGLFHSKSTRKKRKQRRRHGLDKHKFHSRRTNRTRHLGLSTNYEPQNTAEGLRQASESFTKGIIQAAHSIAFVPMEKYKSRGLKSSFKSVLKGIPSAILHPLMGSTQAASNMITGLRNDIDATPKPDLE